MISHIDLLMYLTHHVGSKIKGHSYINFNSMPSENPTPDSQPSTRVDHLTRGHIMLMGWDVEWRDLLRVMS